MVDGEALIARAPFMDVLAVSGNGRGVIASDRDGLGLATVIVRRGQLEVLSQRIRERFGIDLPRGNFRKEAQHIAFAGLGPETWLATSEMGGNDFSASLREEIGAFASISDQSDGYAVLRLTGTNIRDMLAKLILIDVHPRALKPGDVASTVASHIGVILWRLDDAPDATPVFEIAVFRSLAGSFWHSLTQSAAEFGFITS